MVNLNRYSRHSVSDPAESNKAEQQLPPPSDTHTPSIPQPTAATAEKYTFTSGRDPKPSTLTGIFSDEETRSDDTPVSSSSSSSSSSDRKAMPVTMPAGPPTAIAPIPCPVIPTPTPNHTSVTPPDKEEPADHEAQQETAAAAATTDTQNHLPFGPRLLLIIGSLMLAVFCMALDNTIIAVAIPQITDEFHALDDVGWYASGYLLPGCAFQLLFGKFYALFRVKWVLLGALAVFEAGSLLCAVAPSSAVLIGGRAVAGLGSAGIFTGAFVVVAHCVEVGKRPAYLGGIGGVYGIASVAGPLVRFRVVSAPLPSAFFPLPIYYRPCRFPPIERPFASTLRSQHSFTFPFVTLTKS